MFVYSETVHPCRAHILPVTRIACDKLETGIAENQVWLHLASASDV